MQFQTPTQFLILGLLLVTGWLFGLASHPGGRKWKNWYDEEKLDHAQYRDEVEGQLRLADIRMKELETANASLTRDNASLRSELDAARARPALAPVAAVSAPVIASSEARPAFAPSAEPAAVVDAEPAPADPVPASDDLSRLRGLDAATEAKLKAEGVTKFADLASLSDTDEIALEQRLELPAGFIQREQWREQAALLAENKNDAHKVRFAPRD